jgi:hypothetical protein
MITGMNTNVRLEGTIFHVQTEEIGKAGVRLQTLVYHSGRILRNIEKDRADLNPDDEGAVRNQLMHQHRTVIQAVLRGRIVVDQENDSVPEELPTLVVDPLEPPRVGRPAGLLILLRTARSFNPRADEEIRISIRDGAGQESLLHSAITDAKGFHLAEFRVPEIPGTDLSLLVTAGTGPDTVQATIPVIPSQEAWIEQTAPELLQEPVDLVVADIEPVKNGHKANLMILARGCRTCSPIAGAEIRILYTEELNDYLLIYQGLTDNRGIAEAEPTIPIANGPRAMLTIEVRSGPVSAEVVLPVFIPSR